MSITGTILGVGQRENSSYVFHDSNLSTIIWGVGQVHGTKIAGHKKYLTKFERGIQNAKNNIKVGVLY